jgi:uncharacterized protein
MNILLVGATGMIGSRILAEARARGHGVTAAVRNVTRVPPSVSSVALQADDAVAVSAAAVGHDVIIGAVSPRSTGHPVAEATAVTEALIAAARATGARLMVVGGAGATSLPDGSPTLAAVPEIYQAEAQAGVASRNLLAASEVDWTFVPPPFEVGPGARTGTYRTGGGTVVIAADGSSRISAEDYAVAFVDAMERGTHRRAMMSVGT